MTKITAAEDHLLKLEEEWGKARLLWSKSQWLTAATTLGYEYDRLAENLREAYRKIGLKRGRGRPPNRKYKDVIADAHWQSLGGRPPKRRGRRKKYDDEYWPSLLEAVDHWRNHIELETGKRPNIKNAITRLVRQNAKGRHLTNREERELVERLRRHHSRAKSLVQNIEKN